MRQKENILKDKSITLAIEIVNLCKILNNEKKEYVLSKQLLRAGTSIGANVHEAQCAESPADFVHKLSISQKECNETDFWLELLFRTQYISEEQYKVLMADVKYLINILSKSIITVKNKINKNEK
ncbi:hypothetical protein FACS1894178_5570 [Bacteroidia bacterium]|nr:hypothetical protein FACS1894178_5570 [Bacteroidia bacterium]